MSTVAIDSARTNDRLNAFKSEIGANEPIDNYFPRIPVWEKLMAGKKTLDGGRQAMYPIDSGSNTTVKNFSDYDVFDTSGQSTTKMVIYPMVNKGGTHTISWEELREIAGNDHMIFDRVKHGRDNLVKTAMDAYATDLFAATQDALAITSLNVLISATGTVGSLSQADDSDWAAKVVASGSFATQGFEDMRSLYNQLVEDGADPDVIVTNRTIYEFFEDRADTDTRYVQALPGKVQDLTLNRGAMAIAFKGIPILHDKKSTSGVLYMWDSRNLWITVDTEGNFNLGDYVIPYNQEVHTAKFKARLQLICNRRKSTGKLTGVVA